MKRKTAYTFVELLVVIALLSIIIALGYRSMRRITTEAVQLAQASSSERKVLFDRFIALQNDRLAQAWSYTVTPVTVGSYSGNALQLINSGGTNIAIINVCSSGPVYYFELVDQLQLGDAPLVDLVYMFTNRADTTEFNMTSATNNWGVAIVSWAVPPPFYQSAAYSALQPLFPSALSDADLIAAVEAQRTNNAGLLQYDVRRYRWSPQQEAFR